MNPGTNSGFRQPTASEREYIAAFWLPELQRRVQPNAYRVILAIGWAFSIVLGLSLTVVPVSNGNRLVFAVLAGIFLMVGRIQRKNSRNRSQELTAVSQGQYWVAEAFADRLLTYPRGSLPKAIGEIRGFGQCQMPYSPVSQLLQRNVQSGPVLVIRVGNELPLLAVPQPSYHP